MVCLIKYDKYNDELACVITIYRRIFLTSEMSVIIVMIMISIFRKMKLESALKDLSWIISADAIAAAKNIVGMSMATLARSSRPSVVKKLKIV